MENEKKKCYNCGWYKPYYTKEFLCFAKLDRGACHFAESGAAEKNGCCEHWCTKYVRKKRRREAAVISLKRATEALTTIEQILLEDLEDK